MDRAVVERMLYAFPKPHVRPPRTSHRTNLPPPHRAIALPAFSAKDGRMMYRFLAVALSGVVLTACAYDPLKPLDPALAIAPGVYGNVRDRASSGEWVGTELRLAQGGASTEIEVVTCEGTCRTVHRVPLRRQGDDIRCALPVDGDSTPRMVQLTPMPGGVLLSSLAGQGADGVVLRHQRRELGLAMARAAAARQP